MEFDLENHGNCEESEEDEKVVVVVGEYAVGSLESSGNMAHNLCTCEQEGQRIGREKIWRTELEMNVENRVEVKGNHKKKYQ